MTDTATKKAALEAALETREFVPVLYEKEGETKSYLLTKINAPAYEAKTARVKVETPAHLIQAYDQTRGRFVSLKVGQIKGI